MTPTEIICAMRDEGLTRLLLSPRQSMEECWSVIGRPDWKLSNRYVREGLDTKLFVRICQHMVELQPLIVVGIDLEFIEECKVLVPMDCNMTYELGSVMRLAHSLHEFIPRNSEEYESCQVGYRAGIFYQVVAKAVDGASWYAYGLTPHGRDRMKEIPSEWITRRVTPSERAWHSSAEVEELVPIEDNGIPAAEFLRRIKEEKERLPYDPKEPLILKVIPAIEEPLNSRII